MKKESLPSDVDRIIDEINATPKDVKDRRLFQHILLCVELQDMAIERDIYRRIAIDYCDALIFKSKLLRNADRKKMVDGEAMRMYRDIKQWLEEKRPKTKKR